MSQLSETLQSYSDQYLLDQYFNHKEEYTPEALDMMLKEIGRRKIDEKDMQNYLPTVSENAENAGSANLRFRSDDFIRFDSYFTHTDILLVHAILRDNKIPFFVDNPTSDQTIPLENEAEKSYTIQVHKDYEEKTHELLNEHFEVTDGKYELKCSDIRDRLKAFSFSDIRLSEKEAEEETEVVLTEEEKKYISGYARRLLDEADEVEQKQDRVIFYYDSIENLIQKLDQDNRNALSRTDLLTILEVLQVYCDDPDFPESLDDSICSLLDFFLK